MKDGNARWAVKFIARCVFNLNVAGTRALWRAMGRRPFVLAGNCEKCAQCCEAPGIQVGFVLWYFPTMRRLFLWWQRKINGFELIERDVAHRTYVFRCTHFDPTTRRCDSYDTRPGMCRDYPRVHLYQAAPEFLPKCGYRAVRCGADKFITALEKEGFKGEDLEKLKEKLRLK